MPSLLRIFAVVLVTLVLVSCQTLPTEREKALEAQVNNRDTELARAQTTIADLETQVTDLQERLRSLTTELQSLTKGTTNLTQTREELARERDSLRARAGELEALVASLNARLAASAAELANLKGVNAELTKSRDTLSASLVEKQDALKSTVATLLAEKDELLKKVAELTQINDTLNASLSEQTQRLNSAVDQLRNRLKVEVERGDVDILLYRDVIIVNIKDSLGFQPDSPVLRPELGPILNRVAEIFAKFPEKVIRVEGHTAVAPSRWSNSWDLGASRAVNVVRYFQEKAGVDPTRLVAISFGQYRPLEPNLTEAQREKNRRVEIVLVERPLYQVNELVNSGKTTK